MVVTHLRTSSILGLSPIFYTSGRLLDRAMRHNGYSHFNPIRALPKPTSTTLLDRPIWAKTHE